jgi:hypothetical protein
MGNARDSFHPADPEPVKRDAKSGLLALMQQCICAIELIGMTLLGGEHRIDTLRAVRDRLLATTQAGREWILLFEDLQARVLPVVLADDALAERVASVVGRAGDAVADETASIEPELVADAVEVLSEVARRVDDPGVSAGVTATREALEAARGRPVGELLERLVARGPAG